MDEVAQPRYVCFMTKPTQEIYGEILELLMAAGERLELAAATARDADITVPGIAEASFSLAGALDIAARQFKEAKGSGSVH